MGLRSLFSWRQSALLRSVCMGGAAALGIYLGSTAGRMMGVTASMEIYLQLAGVVLCAMLAGTLSLVILKKRRDG